MNKIFLLMTVVVLMTTAVGTLATDRWINYTAGNNVRAIACEGQRYVWCGGHGGAARFDINTGQRVVYTKADGLADNDVAAIAVDSMGNKWFGTSRGGVSVLSQMPAISVSINQPSYHLDDRMIVEASLQNPAPLIAVDIYLGVGLPDGTFLSWPSLNEGLMPAYDDFTIPDSFSFGPSVILEMNLPELPAGDYFWFAGMTKPGYVSQTVGDIFIAPWSFE